MRDPRTATWLGLALTVLGFALIAIAWNGASQQLIVEAQVPFLISGGIGGLALVVAGSALLVAQTFRRHAERLLAAMLSRGAAAEPASENREEFAPVGRQAVRPADDTDQVTTLDA